MSTKTVVVGRLKAVVGPPEQSPRRAAKVGGEPPEWIQIFPDGEYSYDWKGKVETAICDAESRAMIIAEFQARGNDLVIDYEHQTLDGEQAPAAGWIKELEDRSTEGLWGRVEWTSKAREYLLTGEYRYDSPVFSVDRDATWRITSLDMLALTNWPASHNRTALTEQIAAKVQARHDKRKATAREGGMDWNKDRARSIIRWGAEIPSTATNNDVRNFWLQVLEQIPADDNLFIFDESGGTTVAASLGVAYSDTTAPAPTPTTELVAAKAVLDELELPVEATLAQVHARIGEMRTPSDMVAASAHQAVVIERDQLKTRIAELEATTEEEKLNQLITANRKKISPAKEPWFRALAKRQGIEHAADVVKHMKDELPEDVASSVPPPAPSVDTPIATTRRVRDKEIAVDPESAMRKAKVEAIQKENPKLSYREASDELKSRETAAGA